jgi:hypothetical protein
MTFKRPPAIASWCLVHFSDPDEGLLGDMFEEYQHRQSRRWYWRQVAIAIVVGFARNVWTHKLETLQAMFTVTTALGVGARAVIEPLMRLASAIFGRGWSLPPGSWTDVFMWLASALWFVAAVTIGMMVARLHPVRRVTMTLASVVFLAVWNLPEWYRMATNAVELGPRFVPYLVNSLLYFLNISTGLFVGSLWMRAVPSRIERA